MRVASNPRRVRIHSSGIKLGHRRLACRIRSVVYAFEASTARRCSPRRLSVDRSKDRGYVPYLYRLCILMYFEVTLSFSKLSNLRRLRLDVGESMSTGSVLRRRSGHLLQPLRGRRRGGRGSGPLTRFVARQGDGKSSLPSRSNHPSSLARFLCTGNTRVLRYFFISQARSTKQISRKGPKPPV